MARKFLESKGIKVEEQNNRKEKTMSLRIKKKYKLNVKWDSRIEDMTVEYPLGIAHRLNVVEEVHVE